MVYDATDTGPLAIPRVERRDDGTARGTGGLTRWWRLGAVMHKLIMHADAAIGASSWKEALRFAIDQADARGAKIGELQAWGHGGWGYMGMGKQALDVAALSPSASIADEVSAFRDRLSPDALVWLRCCSAFGGEAGRAFAPKLAERLRARVAAHTFIIGAWQSGTHSLSPGGTPDWSVEEGVELRGGKPSCAKDSTARAPRTITCLRPGLPDGW